MCESRSRSLGLLLALLGAMGERVVLAARTSMVRRYRRATVPDLTARPSGELVTRVTSDTVLLSEAASSSLVGIINSTVMLVGTLVLMGVLDLVLLGTTVVAVIVVTVLILLVMPSIAKAKEEAQEHLGRLGGTLDGALRAIKTVKANRAEERLERRSPRAPRLRRSSASARPSRRRRRGRSPGPECSW